MKPIVRIGTIKDQDRWRREDLRKCSPNERVDILVQIQNNFLAGKDRSIVPVVRIRQLGNG